MTGYKKMTVVCLGIFLGGLIYGIHTAVCNYNSIVPPGKELQVFAELESRGRYILMGEKFDVPVPKTADFLSSFVENEVEPIIKEACRKLAEFCSRVEEFIKSLC